LDVNLERRKKTANPRKMVVFGKSADEDGHTVTGGVPLEDLKTHALVVGTTGSGKSTLLRDIAIQTHTESSTNLHPGKINRPKNTVNLHSLPARSMSFS
jgi:ABC-type lipoprotein export system ATPase subunit